MRRPSPQTSVRLPSSPRCFHLLTLDLIPEYGISAKFLSYFTPLAAKVQGAAQPHVDRAATKLHEVDDKQGLSLKASAGLSSLLSPPPLHNSDQLLTQLPSCLFPPFRHPCESFPLILPIQQRQQVLQRGSRESLWLQGPRLLHHDLEARFVVPPPPTCPPPSHPTAHRSSIPQSSTSTRRLSALRSRRRLQRSTPTHRRRRPDSLQLSTRRSLRRRPLLEYFRVEWGGASGAD